MNSFEDPSSEFTFMGTFHIMRNGIYTQQTILYPLTLVLPLNLPLTQNFLYF